MGIERIDVRVLLGALGLVAVALSGCSGSSDDHAPEATKTETEATTTTAVAADDDLKLNEIQVMGTHNSFHIEPPAPELAKLSALDAEQAEQRRYTHPDLTTQLGEQRIRQIELDVFADSQGGLYSDPAFAASDAEGVAAMDEPGTKVLHEQDVDYHSVCPTLVACLGEVKAWSDANPGHVPVAVNIQFKDGPLIFDVPDQAVPEKWTGEAMDGLDAEIRSVFDEDQIITPDDVRGDHATLEEAVLAKDW
ncbi:MAG TPA: Ca2+-dependent phosphoinositide-specific phospholipase C, partial [Acidimicrobiales bacterium]|nr:Ca2+-dependent phosphoinositide-specific phospholipase C [Acidimicrobiales bacterium]